MIKENNFIKSCKLMTDKEAKLFSKKLKTFSESEDDMMTDGETVEITKTPIEGRYRVLDLEDNSVVALDHNPVTDEMKIEEFPEDEIEIEEKELCDTNKMYSKEDESMLREKLEAWKKLESSKDKKEAELAKEWVKHYMEELSKLEKKTMSHPYKGESQSHDSKDEPDMTESADEEKESHNKRLKEFTNKSNMKTSEVVKQFTNWCDERGLKTYTENDIKTFSYDMNLPTQTASKLFSAALSEDAKMEAEAAKKLEKEIDKDQTGPSAKNDGGFVKGTPDAKENLKNFSKLFSGWRRAKNFSDDDEVTEEHIDEFAEEVNIPVKDYKALKEAFHSLEDAVEEVEETEEEVEEDETPVDPFLDENEGDLEPKETLTETEKETKTFSFTNKATTGSFLHLL